MNDVPQVPEESLKKFARLLDRAKEIESTEKAQNDFMSFVQLE